MGQTKSKSAETVSFYTEPEIPIQLSPNFIRQLQGLPPAFAPPPFASDEIPADIDDIVAERVQRELEKAKQRRFFYEQLSADQVTREVEDLLRRQKSIPKPQAIPKYVAKEEAVIRCYKANPTRPLDCWREVEEFKSAAREAQKEFVVKNANHAFSSTQQRPVVVSS
ncbi:hypothetical protein HK102_011232 [Quaeritorhiza haematococci]|nr:hypothetical protein HK102_011232 [Quaeritorhiza haematococci]